MMASAIVTQFLLPPPPSFSSSSSSSSSTTNSLIRTSSTKNTITLSLLSEPRPISSRTLVITPKRNPFPAPPAAAAADTQESPAAEEEQLSEPAPVEVQIAASASAEVPKGEDVFAVVMVGSRQYIVFPGRFLYTQRLKDANVDDKIILNKVLLVGTREKAYIGQPVVTNAAVHAVVEEQGLNKKVIVYKYKRKKNYRRNIGHRQPNTRIRITGITGYEDFPADTMPETIPA